MVRLVFLAFAVATFQQAPEPAIRKSVLLDPPEKSGMADLKKAAEVLQARCAEYGWKGIVTKVVAESEKKLSVEVFCDTGITDAMIPTLWQLGLIVASSVEIRIGANLSGPESQQYQRGKTCPKDMEWIKSTDPDWSNDWKRPKDYDGLELVKKSPRFDVKAGWKGAGSGFAKQRTGIFWVKSDPELQRADREPDQNNESYFEFDEKLSVSLAALLWEKDGTPIRQNPLMLYIDGMYVSTEGTFKHPSNHGGRARWVNETSKAAVFGICLNNPSTLPLKLRADK